jgi:sulfonate transport system substrate-binding protein
MPRPKVPRAVLLAVTATAVVAAAWTSGSPAGAAKSAAPAASGSPIPASVPAGTTLRVADQLDVLETPLALSGDNKNFPYKVSYSTFVGGPSMLQAFQGGAVDLGWVAGTPAIFAQAAHQGAVVVAAYATAKSTYSLVNGPGQHITSWARLKGKSVAYQQGTVEESILLQGLQSAGLTLKDVTSVNLSTTSLVPALEAGKVDTAILVEPLTGVYLAKDPNASQVPLTNDITNRDGFLIASAAALKDPAREAAIADYLKRFVTATTWENTHIAAAAASVYVDEYHLPLAAGEAIIKATGPTEFYGLPGPFLKPQQNLANLYAQAGVIPAAENVSAEFSSLFNATVTKAARAATTGTSGTGTSS